MKTLKESMYFVSVVVATTLMLSSCAGKQLVLVKDCSDQQKDGLQICEKVKDID